MVFSTPSHQDILTNMSYKNKRKIQYLNGGGLVEKWHSIQELADKLSMSHTSISRYINQFPNFFDVKKTGKRKMIAASGEKVLRRIKTLFEEGKTKEEVRAILEGDSPVVHVINEEDQILTYLNRLEEQNAQLFKELQEQKAYIQERDQQYFEVLNKVLETKQKIASDVNIKKKKRWFRFFQNNE
ncbi:MerR family transcriptional regulator [Bacillus toyonensis]|uniref:MerR family transcriptional regulator n=2 Tax=Bacillus toyonensis TaxID=155322 RepID=UPI0011A0529B|nr:MerR family transcriptional regulator [Bacillus toyonensis]